MLVFFALSSFVNNYCRRKRVLPSDYNSDYVNKRPLTGLTWRAIGYNPKSNRKRHTYTNINTKRHSNKHTPHFAQVKTSEYHSFSNTLKNADFNSSIDQSEADVIFSVFTSFERGEYLEYFVFH